MAEWVILDYVEPSGRNPIREWLDGLPMADQAKVDYRLQQMLVLPKWSDKWVSKYRGTKELYEFRISGNKVQYRPLGTYYGRRTYVLLAGAIEKGDEIPKRDIDTAKARLDNLRRGAASTVLHRFDEDENE